MYEPDFQCDGNTAPVIAPSPAVWSKKWIYKRGSLLCIRRSACFQWIYEKNLEILHGNSKSQ